MKGGPSRRVGSKATAVGVAVAKHASASVLLELHAHLSWVEDLSDTLGRIYRPAREK